MMSGCPQVHNDFISFHYAGMDMHSEHEMKDSSEVKNSLQERKHKLSGFRHKCLIFPSKLGLVLNQ